MTQVALDVLHTGPVTAEASTAPGRLASLARRFATLRATPHLVTWLGIGTAAIGVVLLIVAWGKTAGLTNVALQIPYLISAGFTGVALVIAGLTVVNIDAKRTDAAERSRQLAELRGLLAELRSTVEDEQ